MARDRRPQRRRGVRRVEKPQSPSEAEPQTCEICKDPMEEAEDIEAGAHVKCMEEDDETEGEAAS